MDLKEEARVLPELRPPARNQESRLEKKQHQYIQRTPNQKMNDQLLRPRQRGRACKWKSLQGRAFTFGTEKEMAQGTG
jgi:hypothetical protein